MRTVTVIISDELGNVTNDQKKHIYPLDLKTEGFNGIEKAVIDLKGQMLPDIQKQLLEEEQEEFIQNKDASLRCNGTTPVRIKTLNGSFPFKNQRFLENNCDQTSHTYLGLTNQFEDRYTSDGLNELSGYYANRLSYAEVEELVERTTGEKQLTGQSVQNIVEDKALEVSKQVKSEALSVLGDDAMELPEIEQEVDVYDAEAKEVLIMVDGIIVKKQKESRDSSKKASSDTESNTDDTEKSTGSRVNSNVVLLEKKTGEFEHITSAIDNEGEELLPLCDIVKSKVIEEYGSDEEPLKVVAISDGAKDIRNMLMAVFGVLIFIILDWYHLCKKVRDFMSMIARSKPEKIEHLEFLLYHLWHGQTQEVLDYLNNNVEAKNEEKLQELIGYIEKHREEIIDYDRRKKAGKEIGLEKEEDIDNQSSSKDSDVQNQPSSNGKAFKKADTVENACDNVIKRCREDKEEARLEQEREAIDSDVQNQPSSNGKAVKKVVGSGRVEKACDSIVGKRQKHKAMSWSKPGSRSLAILKAVELNNRWLDIWFPPPIAANDLQRAANDSCASGEIYLVA